MYLPSQIRVATACHLDFETYSRTDLLKHGAYRYAQCPSTGPHICSYAFDDGPVVRWLPGDPYPFKDFRGHFYAWNAQFERLIWWHVMTRHGWPAIPLERFRCVAAMSRASALPGKLENAARCLNVRQQKDRRGKELIKLLCIPQGDGSFNRDPDLLSELFDYCDQDVRAERDLERELRPLSDYEWSCYHQSERVNDRGLRIDTDFAEVAVGYADEEKAFFAERLVELTQGQVQTARQFQKIKDWVWPHLSPPARKMCTHYKGGEKKVSFDKAVRHNILDAAQCTDHDGPFITPEGLEFTEIIDLAGNSSVSKYQTMLDLELGGRVRGLYIWSGAGQTGRYSSVKLQVHNLKRDVLQDFLNVRQAFMDGKEIEGVIPKLAGMIRPCVLPQEGHRVVWGDWSAIEARALPWLSGDPLAGKKLDLFREGVDVYKRNAALMGFDPIEGRQTGKVAELSLGYGGGIGAFQSMARNYQVRVADELAAKIRDMWRLDNPWAQKFWYALDNAALTAMHRPGERFEVGRVAYVYTPGIMNGIGALWCELPTGRYICYPGARLEDLETPWGEPRLGITAIKGNWLPKQDETEWPRVSLWYGMQAENITQAVCADILNRALLRCEAAGLNVVMHTHDEIGVETQAVKGDARKLFRIMKNPDPVFDGLPLDVEIESGERYKIKEWKLAA